MWLNTDKNTKVSDHFSYKEFMCNDGSEYLILDNELVERLEVLRKLVNAPIHINSGYRTSSYNKKVGGVRNSQHLYGKASDITCKAVTVPQLRKLCYLVGFRCVLKYDTFVHCDTRANTYYEDAILSKEIINKIKEFINSQTIVKNKLDINGKWQVDDVKRLTYIINKKVKCHEIIDIIKGVN